MSELPRLIPLGSAVRLKNEEEDTQVYVVIGRAFMDAQTSGYQAVAYPYGYGEKYRIHVFKGQELEVVLEGYSIDEEETAFIQERLAEMEERQKNPPPKIVSHALEETQEKTLSHEEQLKEDPFYKFRKVEEK
ncbi:DUF4176 domain-containing protein [Lactococcus ileimucosae]|uniref:DUF4176 domain-containing protein n=1 Tax=Lactococcus ileimucosae TaxID=2941329 RepID=UPI0020437FAB|nr:DUF4176 domain-containing protein [Lactococcus ileimucosae]